MRKWVLLLAAVCLLSACAPVNSSNEAGHPVERVVKVSEAEEKKGLPVFEIIMKNGDTMRGELYPDIAPHSAGNFIQLANTGYYDGLIFHRVIPGFMIQGGCPNGTGMGNPGYSIRGEFSANGHDNALKHTPGVLSMARSQHPDSAGSQFFIMTSNSPHLDGNYAAFGQVLSGMDTAEKIVNQKRNTSDKPLTDQVIASIRVETFGKEYPFEQLK